MKTGDLFSQASGVDLLTQFHKKISDAFYERLEEWLIKHKHTENELRVEARESLKDLQNIIERDFMCLDCMALLKISMTHSKHGFHISFWDTKFRIPGEET